MGPTLIDTNAHIRVVPSSGMPGRLTATARQLTDPANMVYYYDMEGKLYEANVHTLAVKKLFENPMERTGRLGSDGNLHMLPGRVAYIVRRMINRLYGVLAGINVPYCRPCWMQGNGTRTAAESGTHVRPSWWLVYRMAAHKGCERRRDTDGYACVVL